MIFSKELLKQNNYHISLMDCNGMVTEHVTYYPWNIDQAIKEKQNDFFEMFGDIPYMNQVVKVKPEYVNKLKAVTHIDGTARVQTVYENTQMHTLLGEFEKLSGYPILLNTSFNIKDKTMVLTPKDAVETFMNTDMDILVMGNFVITK
jgi:carbamoyltransferase